MRELLGKKWLVYLLLAVTCLIAFAPGMRGPFVFDDTYWKQTMIQPLQNPSHDVWGSYFRPVIPDTVPYGRPLLKILLQTQVNVERWLTRMLDKHDGTDPDQFVTGNWGSTHTIMLYHFISLLLHLCNAILVFKLLSKLTDFSPDIRAMLTMLWALHPLQTDAVLYISQQSELLVSLFILLTLNLALSHRYKLAVLTCFVGMFCKELMVVTPLLVWLAMSIGKRERPLMVLRENKAFFAALWACCLVVVLLMWRYPRSQSTGNIDGWNNINYLLTQSQVLCHYLLQCIWPSRLAIDPWFPQATSILSVWPYGLVILCLLIIAGYLLYRQKQNGFWLAWFFIILAPTSSFIPITTEVAAQRRMYLPLLGILIILTCIASRLLAQIKASHRLVHILAVASVLMAGITFIHSSVYQSQVQLYEDTIAKFPDNQRAIRNLGSWYFDSKEYQNAINMYSRVIASRPNDISVHEDRIKAYAQLGHLDQAQHLYEAMLKDDPDNAIAQYLLGHIYARQGNLESACETLLKVLPHMRQPYATEVKRSLAKIYLQWGMTDKALFYLTQIVNLQGPSKGFAPRVTLEDLNMLGILYAQSQQWDKAQTAFKKALTYSGNNMTQQLYLDIQANLKKVNQKLSENAPASTPPDKAISDVKTPDSKQ